MTMKLIYLFFVMNGLISPMSAEDFFEGIFKQGRACFKVKKTPSSCNATLTESFEPTDPSPGINEADTKVYLFTPDSPDEAELLHECGGRLPPGSTYDNDADTEIFIHGWIDGVCRSAWMRESKNQLMKRGRYNVLLVDWTWGNFPDYYLSSQNCKTVGDQVGFVINNIINQRGVDPDKFHIVGHSFGAIAAGFLSRSMKGLPRRITALDPAFAPFRDVPPDQRLTYRDARIVDVIHTNGGKCFGITAGDKRQLGHADFYPNGGTTQLSCYYAILVYFLTGDFVAGLGSLSYPPLCFHIQSTVYYKASINPDGCPFIGVESESYNNFLLGPQNSNGNRTTAIMGMDFEKTYEENGEQRKFYLKTKLTCPYVDYSHLSSEEIPPKCQARKS